MMAAALLLFHQRPAGGARVKVGRRSKCSLECSSWFLRSFSSSVLMVQTVFSNNGTRTGADLRQQPIRNSPRNLMTIKHQWLVWSPEGDP